MIGYDSKKDVYLCSSSLYEYPCCYSVVGDLMRPKLGWPPAATLYNHNVSNAVNGALKSF
eukprot:scaffold7196_cov100-Skeletonema_marinoi.AAC.1